MKIVHNHWGWTPIGIWRWIWRWISTGWAHPIQVWGVELRGQVRRYRRRVKIGPFCFGLGSYTKAITP